MVVMAQRLRSALTISLLIAIALLSGCKHRAKNSPVVVHVLRNLSSPYGSEMDHRILDYQGSNPKLPSGQPITIQSETGDYKDMLTKQTATSEGVDVIVLDSGDDVQGNSVLQAAVPQATNVCAGLKACPTVIPAIIPAQVGGATRDAAQSFVIFLQKAP
jgi:hypothetical protein